MAPGPPNPYVGPKPFENQRLFGRDREIAEIGYLLTSERIVLLYAASGAGKSSLVQAGLIPKLKDRFDIWGPTRVNQEPPKGVGNRYIWSTVAGLARRSDIAKDIKLGNYVKERRGKANPLIIFDQFEEVLRVDPVDFEVKRSFFDELGELLHDSGIWALFILREDYLAPLDSYARLIPTYFHNRYHLDRLARDMAAQAIANPTLDSPRKYAEGVVDKLVNNLAAVKIPQPDGSLCEEAGKYVEPLQLQVVCFDVWDRMKSDAMVIQETDIGDVDGALQNYYTNALAKMANSDLQKELAIRDWFQYKLITPEGLRNQIRQEARQSGGLDNAVVLKLLDTYMVRAEPRGAITWYELAHDRLIGPIRQSNRAWFDKNLNKLQKTAILWAQDRPEGLLLQGADLDAAIRFSLDNEMLLKPAEKDLLRESIELRKKNREAQLQIEKDRKQARLIQSLLMWLGVFFVLTLVAGGYSGWQWYRNVRLTAEAVKAREAADNAKNEAVVAKKDAEQGALDAQEVAREGQVRNPPVLPAAAAGKVCYIQIRKEAPAQVAEANTMKQILLAKGWVVPRIESLTVGPTQRQVRYFRKAQAAQAQTIATLIGGNAVPTYVKRNEATDAAHAPSHFEIWLEAPTPAPAQTVAQSK